MEIDKLEIYLIGMFGMFGILSIFGIFYLLYKTYKNYLVNKKINLIDEKKLSLKDFEELDDYLNKKLEELFRNFTFTHILPILKKFSSISEANRKKLRNEFIERFDFITTNYEKKYYQDRYQNFEIFKFKIMDFFNIKITKLELLCINKLSMDKNEFKDEELYKSLFDGISKADMDNIQEILSSINGVDTPEKNK